MAFKHLILLLVSAVAVQATIQEETHAVLAGIEADVVEMKKELDVVVERFPNLEVSEIRDLLETYVDIEKILEILIFLDRIFGEGQLGDIVCILQNIKDGGVVITARELVQEIKRIVGRIAERDELLEECNRIGGENPSVVDKIRRRACRLRVTGNIGAEIVKELRELNNDIQKLLEHVKNLLNCKTC